MRASLTSTCVDFKIEEDTTIDDETIHYLLVDGILDGQPHQP